MMRYFYVLDYAEKDSLHDTTTPSTLDIHARMYVIADKYGITSLQDIARCKFEYEAGVLQSQDSNKVSSLKSLLEAVPIVYTMTPNTDPTLRKMLSQAIACHLHASQKILENPQFREMWFEHPEFGFNVMTRSLVLARFRRDDDWVL
ncbi:MAG: hypothetical protein Q9222_004030, partial [Ikaeria aurantiellina]